MSEFLEQIIRRRDEAREKWLAARKHLDACLKERDRAAHDLQGYKWALEAEERRAEFEEIQKGIGAE